MNIIGSYIFRNEVDRLKELLKIFKSAGKLPRGLMPSDEILRSVLRRKNMIFWVAMDGDTVAGGLIAHVLPSVFGEPASVYLQDLAVKKKYQRKKVGTLLTKWLVIDCRVHGYRNIYVQTKQSNTAAIKFFKSRNATPTQGFHFEYDTVIKVPKIKHG